MEKVSKTGKIKIVIITLLLIVYPPIVMGGWNCAHLHGIMNEVLPINKIGERDFLQSTEQ
jgi:hypothetical protein